MITRITFFLIFSSLQFEFGLADECKWDSSCLCKFTNGSVIDLKPINTKYRDGKEWMFKFTDPTKQQANFQYAFNPCYTVKTSDDCTDSIACQQYVTGDPPEYFPLATMKGEEFITADALYVRYAAVGGDTARTLTVKLVCISSGDDTFEPVGQPDPQKNFYNYTLTSQHCCSSVPASHISLGTILCIIFIVVVVIYIIAGVLVNKFVRGATGAEIIPNRSFWTQQPGLIKEGFQFTGGKIRGCFTRDSTYDTI